MAIPDQEVAQVREATDIVALVGEHAALRRQGQRWVGLCPFHAEKTPSFSVNAEQGLYYCFGCQASGDAISFVRAVEHLDFADAVRWLADRNGISLHEEEGGGGDRRRRAELLDAMERAVAWYHDRLLAAPDAGRARDYLRSRGYDGELVRHFRLGWAPSGWDELCQALGLKGDIVQGAGLAFVNRRNRLQDAFRGRVIFPICDPSGRPIALGGRVLPPGLPGEPKYKNSTETPIYAKRRTLYALNWAKQDIIASGEVVVCEGYTDVIGCFQAGVPRAVATCGTSLAEEHFQLLRNFGRRIVLAYDADAAGQTATGRVYEWERRHELDLAVASLPPGSDPGELARQDPEALRRAVSEARPFLEFRVEQALKAGPSGELESPEGRARAARRALGVIAEHPDELVRDQYLMVVSSRCRLDEPALRNQLREVLRHPPSDAGRRPERRSARAGPGASHAAQEAAPRSGMAAGRRGGAGVGALAITPAGSRAGLEALRFLIHQRERVAGSLDAVLFADDLQRRAYLAVAAQPDLHQLIAEEQDRDPELVELLRRLAVEQPVVVEESLGDPAVAVVVQLVRLAAWRALGELAAQARANPGSWAEASAAMSYLRLQLRELDPADDGNADVDGLVAWLAVRDRRADDQHL